MVKRYGVKNTIRRRGETYYLIDIFPFKRDANEEADHWRSREYSVVVVPTSEGWGVYYR